MQLTASRETLTLALSRANGIVGKKTTMPILSNVLLETTASDRFTITATDLDIFSKGEYEGIIEGKGGMCINARDLFEIVRSMPPGNVKIEQTEGNNVAISSGSINFRIPTIAVDDYPGMPEFGEVEYFSMETEVLKGLIDHTIFSVASDDPRIFLNGVNLEKLEEKKIRLASTDGHRLSLIDKEFDFEIPVDDSVIIPRKGLAELRRLLEEGGESIELAFHGSNAFFRREGLIMVMRLIEGEFPDYNMVVPKTSDKKIKLDRIAFADALKRISFLSADRSYAVRMILKPGEFIIESSDPEKGEGRESLPTEYDGEEVNAGFNARYFLDAISVIDNEEVLLELSDELSPCVVKESEEGHFLCVIMPVRI